MTRLTIIGRFIHLASASVAIGVWAGDWKAGGAAFGVLTLIDVWVLALANR